VPTSFPRTRSGCANCPTDTTAAAMGAQPILRRWRRHHRPDAVRARSRSNNMCIRTGPFALCLWGAECASYFFIRQRAAHAAELVKYDPLARMRFG
jgi:hypothetical protein